MKYKDVYHTTLLKALKSKLCENWIIAIADKLIKMKEFHAWI